MLPHLQLEDAPDYLQRPLVAWRAATELRITHLSHPLAANRAEAPATSRVGDHVVRRVTEVARRYGVSRQAVHGWLGRYERDGLAGLADHSHRPFHQPRQLDAGVEALICQWRGAHPRWGPRRLVFELGKAKVSPLPSRSTVYRVLVRHGLVPARRRKRRRQDYRRWQREEPMQLWQLDVTGSVFLADGTELKLISGIDDCSRFCVIATVVRRATARAVCRAFVAAMRTYGIPEEAPGRRLAGPDPLPHPRLAIQRNVSSRGGIQVARQRIQVGLSHAGKTVTIELGDTTLRVIDQHGELIATVPRNGAGEISRFKAYGTRRTP